MTFTPEQVTKLQEFVKDYPKVKELLEEVLKYPINTQFVILNARITTTLLISAGAEALCLQVVKSALLLTPL